MYVSYLLSLPKGAPLKCECIVAMVFTTLRPLSKSNVGALSYLRKSSMMMARECGKMP